MTNDMNCTASARSGKAGVPEGMPRLSDYYSAPAAQPAAFLRQVCAAGKAARTTGASPPFFDENDAADMLKRLEELDPTLSRTVKLLGKEPPQVRRWVEKVTRDAFDKAVKPRGNGEEAASLARFDRFLRLSAPDLLGEDKLRRERARNLLRLVLPWLVERQNLKLEYALPLVRRAGRTKTANLQRDMKTLLYSTSFTQLLKLSLVDAWYEKALNEEKQERQNVSATLTETRKRENAVTAELEKVKTDLWRTTEERDRLARHLEETEKQLQSEKRLRALDRRQSAARSRGFLLERLAPLLRDAKVALDFRTPHVAGSRERLDMASEAIGQEARRLDD